MISTDAPSGFLGDLLGAFRQRFPDIDVRLEEGTSQSVAAGKILAFDLAAMCVSIEGATRVPSFLLHDSPREADLGLSIYGRLFDIGHELERVGGKPLFQYIVTTAPPAEFRERPYLQLKLHGDPPAQRLLGVDL